MTRSFFQLSAVLLGILCGFAQGCSSRPNSSEKVLKSPGNQYEISVPPAWNLESDLNDVAEIQAAHRSSEMYVVVIRDMKEDLYGVDLVKFAEITRSSLLEEKKEIQFGPPLPLLIDGYPALQQEIRAVHEHTRVVYLQTVLETPEHFYQILTWTIPSRWEKNRHTLEEIPKRFKETPSKTGPSPVLSETYTLLFEKKQKGGSP